LDYVTVPRGDASVTETPPNRGPHNERRERRKVFGKERKGMAVVHVRNTERKGGEKPERELRGSAASSEMRSAKDQIMKDSKALKG